MQDVASLAETYRILETKHALLPYPVYLSSRSVIPWPVGIGLEWGAVFKMEKAPKDKEMEKNGPKWARGHEHLSA